jgi:hypothetical protein
MTPSAKEKLLSTEKSGIIIYDMAGTLFVETYVLSVSSK